MKSKPVKITDEEGNIMIYPSIANAGVDLNLSITTIRNYARNGAPFKLAGRTIKIEIQDNR